MGVGNLHPLTLPFNALVNFRRENNNDPEARKKLSIVVVLTCLSDIKYPPQPSHECNICEYLICPPSNAVSTSYTFRIQFIK